MSLISNHLRMCLNPEQAWPDIDSSNPFQDHPRIPGDEIGVSGKHLSVLVIFRVLATPKPESVANITQSKSLTHVICKVDPYLGMTWSKIDLHYLDSYPYLKKIPSSPFARISTIEIGRTADINGALKSQSTSS